LDLSDRYPEFLFISLSFLIHKTSGYTLSRRAFNSFLAPSSAA
jgi:hypothetical protein